MRHWIHLSRCRANRCVAAYTVPVAIATGICSIAADAIVLFVIWSTMRSVRSGATNRDVTTSPLIVMLLRNGTVYFILLLSFNILNIVGITCYTFVNAAVFITPISSILISHFLLSLRRYARKPPHPASFPSRLSTVVWDFVSDMGQELGYENRSHDYEIAWRCDDEAIIDRCEAPTSELTHDIEKVPMTTLRNTVGLSQLDD
ncbi:hypothetical protein OBBRIDRAFT_67040 [Obba rivulosa]|uniref:Uncharacterized protein n=1 Tax=Obba rivulosa TaxID=1052685 RepID=A0A8E2AV72_9APHY|nr:hypothetical protein OBBRIDRAFT_67040 [Obba rivulosa]